MTEIWKPMKEPLCESKYSVSSYGRVYNNETEVFVSPVITGIPQYWYVNLLRTDGKRMLRRVHRLVALSFLGEQPEGCSVDHIDRNKHNNSLDNLRWASKKEQTLNRDVTLQVGDVEFIEKVREDFGEDKTVYTFLYNRMREGDSYEEAVINMNRSKLYGSSWNSVQPCGKPLCEVLEQQKISYEQHKQNIRTKRLLGNVAGTGVEYKGMWFAGVSAVCRYYGVDDGSVRKRRKEGMSLEDAIEDTLKYGLIEIGGEWKTKTQWCKQYNTTKDKVYKAMTRDGMSFEEALKRKPDRIIKHKINGEVKRNSEWYKLFGINRVKANTKLHGCKCMRRTLEHFGVDTTNMKISPYTE